MLSNNEPLAREMTVTICRRAGMAEADIGEWVDLHWTCAAAMLEAGVMDEPGEWIPDKDWRRGLAAYREKVASTYASASMALKTLVHAHWRNGWCSCWTLCVW
jgi:hypothetical protein